LLPELIDRNNTASDVWADTAYRSQANEKFLAGRALRSQIHRKKPNGKPMPRRTARANARKSAVRSAVEHVFARQKGPMALFIRTIGRARAKTKSAWLTSSTTCSGWSGWRPTPPHPDPKTPNQPACAAPHRSPEPADDGAAESPALAAQTARLLEVSSFDQAMPASGQQRAQPATQHHLAASKRN